MAPRHGRMTAGCKPQLLQSTIDVSIIHDESFEWDNPIAWNVCWQSHVELLLCSWPSCQFEKQCCEEYGPYGADSPCQLPPFRPATVCWPTCSWKSSSLTKTHKEMARSPNRYHQTGGPHPPHIEGQLTWICESTTFCWMVVVHWLDNPSHRPSSCKSVPSCGRTVLTWACFQKESEV